MIQIIWFTYFRYYNYFMALKNMAKSGTWVSDRDIYPWGVFCEPHWELLCCNKWYPVAVCNITPMEIVPGTQFHVRVALNIYSCSYLWIKKPLGRLFQIWSPVLSDEIVKQCTHYCSIFKVSNQVWESQINIFGDKVINHMWELTFFATATIAHFPKSMFTI